MERVRKSVLGMSVNVCSRKIQCNIVIRIKGGDIEE